MVDKDYGHVGGISRSNNYKEQLALKSLRHCTDDVTFSELFPELKQEIDEKLASNPGKYEAYDDKIIESEDKHSPLFKIAMGVMVVSIVYCCAKMYF